MRRVISIAERHSVGVPTRGHERRLVVARVDPTELVGRQAAHGRHARGTGSARHAGDGKAVNGHVDLNGRERCVALEAIEHPRHVGISIGRLAALPVARHVANQDGRALFFIGADCCVYKEVQVVDVKV